MSCPMRDRRSQLPGTGAAHSRLKETSNGLGPTQLTRGQCEGPATVKRTRSVASA